MVYVFERVFEISEYKIGILNDGGESVDDILNLTGGDIRMQSDE